MSPDVFAFISLMSILPVPVNSETLTIPFHVLVKALFAETVIVVMFRALASFFA